MTHPRTERGRGESGHHGGPHPALRRRDAIRAWSTRRSDLPGVATSLTHRMPTRRKSKWDATTRAARIRSPREPVVGVALQRADAAGSGVRSTPRGHWISFSGIPPWVTKLVCPVSPTGAQPATCAPRFRPRPWSPRCSSASHISHHDLSSPRAAGARRARAAADGVALPPRRARRRTAHGRSVRPRGHPTARSA